MCSAAVKKEAKEERVNGVAAIACIGVCIIGWGTLILPLIEVFLEKALNDYQTDTRHHQLVESSCW
jgi:hypothetical protein